MKIVQKCIPLYPLAWENLTCSFVLFFHCSFQDQQQSEMLSVKQYESDSFFLSLSGQSQEFPSWLIVCPSKSVVLQQKRPHWINLCPTGDGLSVWTGKTTRSPYLLFLNVPWIEYFYFNVSSSILKNDRNQRLWWALRHSAWMVKYCSLNQLKKVA